MICRRVEEGEVVGRSPWRVAVGNQLLPATLSEELRRTYIVLYPGRRVQCIRRETHYHIVGIEATVKEYTRLRFPRSMWKAAERVIASKGDRKRYWYPAQDPVKWLGEVARTMFEGLGFAVKNIDLSGYGFWEPTNLISPLCANQILVMDNVWAAVWHVGLSTQYFAVTPATYEYGSLDEYEQEWEGAEVLRTVLWHSGLRKEFGLEEPPAQERPAVKTWKPELVFC